jgi:hypothetical protein
MNTRISSKLVAFALALMVNSLIMGGVTYLFTNPVSQLSQDTAACTHIAQA